MSIPDITTVYTSLDTITFSDTSVHELILKFLQEDLPFLSIRTEDMKISFTKKVLENAIIVTKSN